jgi:NADH-quinone oxidoreductase subunit C
LEQLKDHAAVARLLAWRPESVQGAKFDRDELSIYILPASIRDVCAFLRDDAELRFNFLSDVTCVDWYPSEPRFEVVYHLVGLPKSNSGPTTGPVPRVRLKVQLPGEDPTLESVVSVWPSANFPEREVFDLFGVRFEGHPYLRRILMPDDWEGNPLRKDYPVEGYR